MLTLWVCFFVVRSEGGAECRKIQEELTTSSGTESASDLPMNGSTPAPPAAAEANGGGGALKPDPDGWAAMGGVVM